MIFDVCVCVCVCVGGGGGWEIPKGTGVCREGEITRDLAWGEIPRDLAPVRAKFLGHQYSSIIY